MLAFYNHILQSRYAKLRELCIWNMRGRKARSRNMYLAEQLEVRHLLSADGASLAMDELLRSELDTAEIIEQLIDTGMVYKAANDTTQIGLILKSNALATHSYDDELVATSANTEGVVRLLMTHTVLMSIQYRACKRLTVINFW
jgi:hypothetical protein